MGISLLTFEKQFAAAEDLFLAARGLALSPRWPFDELGCPTQDELKSSIKSSARNLIELLSDPDVNKTLPEIADLVFKQGTRAQSTANRIVHRYLPQFVLAMAWFDSLTKLQDEEMDKLREDLRTKCLKPILGALQALTRENLMKTALSWQGDSKVMPSMFRENMEALFTTCPAVK